MCKELRKIKCSSEFVEKTYLFMYHRLELNSGTCASKNHYSYEHNKSLRKDKMTEVDGLLLSLLLLIDYVAKNVSDSYPFDFRLSPVLNC